MIDRYLTMCDNPQLREFALKNSDPMEQEVTLQRHVRCASCGTVGRGAGGGLLATCLSCKKKGHWRFCFAPRPSWFLQQTGNKYSMLLTNPVTTGPTPDASWMIWNVDLLIDGRPQLHRFRGQIPEEALLAAWMWAEFDLVWEDDKWTKA